MDRSDTKGPGVPEGVGAGSLALIAGGSGTHRINGNESGWRNLLVVGRPEAGAIAGLPPSSARNAV
jgi:hypothetical protein